MKPAHFHFVPRLIAASLLAACSANTESVGEASGALEIEQLPRIESFAIAGASDGCEGALAGDESFVVDANMLVVAVRGDEPVCIDTLEAIAEELRTLALADRAEIIADAYARTAGVEHPVDPEDTHLTGYSMGDPTPEPNSPAADDPSPEPNRPPPMRGGQPAAPVNDGGECGDPTPEPNSPAIRPLPTGAEHLAP